MRVHLAHAHPEPPHVDDAVRQAMLNDLCACVRDLDSRPVLPMLDLKNYDVTFAPKEVGP